MKFLGIIFFATLVSATASADFSGYWVGTGVMHDSSNWSSNCEMTSVVHQAATTLSVSYHSQCGQLTVDEAPPQMQIVGNQLMAYGQNVGTIDANSIHVKAVSNEGTPLTWDVEMIAPNQMKYNDHLSSKDGYWETQGTLVRQ